MAENKDRNGTDLDRRTLVGLAGATLLAGAAGVTTVPGAALGATGPGGDPAWMPTWTGVTVPPFKSNLTSGAGLENQTQRQMICSTTPAKKVRIRVSNKYGQTPLKLGAASIGVTRAPQLPDLIAGTVRPLRFGGKPSVVIPAGQEVVSDSLDFDLLVHQVVGIDLFYEGPTGPGQFRSNPVQAVYQIAGNHVGIEKAGEGWNGPKPFGHGMAAMGPPGAFLVGLEIPAPAAGGCIVIAGDSTNFGSWPQWLYRRLLGVLGEGTPPVVERTISGQTAVYSSNYAPSLLDTFEENILSVPGVRQVIINVGTNDFGWLQLPNVEPWAPVRKVNEQDMLNAFAQFAKMAKARNVEVYATTIMAGGATRFDASFISGIKQEWTAENEANIEKAAAITRAVNRYIREDGAYTGYFDFYQATVNRLDPNSRDPMYSPDNIHSNAAGWYEMAQCIDVATLAKAWRRA